MEPDPLLNGPRHLALLAENASLRAEMVRMRETMERLEKLLRRERSASERTAATVPSLRVRTGRAPPRPPSAPTGRKRGGQPGRKALIKHWQKLWLSLKTEGVDPTNNKAERALRPLVILKRIFQRLPSAEGKRKGAQS